MGAHQSRGRAGLHENRRLMSPTPTQAAALRQVLDAIVSAVEAAGPTGAPGGVLYAALMCHGVTLERFENLMDALMRAGKLRKSGQCYFVTSKGEPT
jgi:hypothetical protein